MSNFVNCVGAASGCPAGRAASIVLLIRRRIETLAMNSAGKSGIASTSHSNSNPSDRNNNVVAPPSATSDVDAVDPESVNSAKKCDSPTKQRARVSNDGSGGNGQSMQHSIMHTIRSVVVPRLDNSLHKGECGRICVFGGCNLYTGAPYFAAMSALRTGADIVHIMCEQSAGTVIKSYSPELIVHPILDTEYALEEIDKWLPRFHAVVIAMNDTTGDGGEGGEDFIVISNLYPRTGPGLGRDQSMLGRISIVIERVKRAAIPLVIDADGLWHIIQSPDLIVNSRNVLVTPNAMEFSRLAKTVLRRNDIEPNGQPEPRLVADVARCLGGGVTIIHKGASDVISNGRHTELCTDGGSPRRCGGQGDILSGACAVFMHWATATRLHSRLTGCPLPVGEAGGRKSVSSSASSTGKHRKSHSGSSPHSSRHSSTESAEKRPFDGRDGVIAGVASPATSKFLHPGPSIIAAWAAAYLTREAARQAYQQHGRSCTTSDVITKVGPAFSRLFDNFETDIQ